MKSIHAVLVAALAACASVAQAQVVKPPPLPPGSHMVRVEAGLNPEERKRHVRAHHHKAHHKKDFTRDDTMPATAKPPANSNAGGAKK